MAEPLNATFFAFRKRERGGVLLGASVAYAVATLAVVGLFAWLNWQAMLDYFAWSVSAAARQEAVDPNDPSAVFATMMPPPSVMAILPSYVLIYFVIYLLFAAYEAACLRWMIRGEVKGLFGLAPDADTLRVYFTYWLWFFLLMAAYFVFIMVVGLSVGIGAVAAAQGGAESVGGAVVGALLVCFLLLLAVIYVSVRFAPAAATSIAKRRFAFFDAWTVTRGRFWPLLGSFALLWLMALVAIFVLVIGLGMAAGLGMMGQFDPTAQPATSEETLAMFASPSVWIPVAALYVLMIVGSFVFYVALFGVNARAAQAALEDGRIQAAQ